MWVLSIIYKNILKAEELRIINERLIQVQPQADLCLRLMIYEYSLVYAITPLFIPIIFILSLPVYIHSIT